jgi:predicted metal-dependent hydrolase
VALRRSPRARRLTLSVGRADGRARLTIPSGLPIAEAEAFLVRQEAWLRAQLDAVPPRRRPEPGAALPILGVDRALRAGDGRTARWEGGVVVLPRERPGPGVAALLREVARARLLEAVGRHAAALGRRPGRVTLRDARTRWGSCTVRGDLMFSWRIAMAPERVLDYLAAHEVAHLAHMDHSPRFWARVATLVDDHEASRRWLRKNGAALQAWDFSDN